MAVVKQNADDLENWVFCVEVTYCLTNDSMRYERRSGVLERGCAVVGGCTASTCVARSLMNLDRNTKIIKHLQ